MFIPIINTMNFHTTNIIINITSIVICSCLVRAVTGPVLAVVRVVVVVAVEWAAVNAVVLSTVGVSILVAGPSARNTVLVSAKFHQTLVTSVLEPEKVTSLYTMWPAWNVVQPTMALLQLYFVFLLESIGWLVEFMYPFQSWQHKVDSWPRSWETFNIYICLKISW
jgi:hypothetical protein